jgi:hypothetical protein
MIGNVPSFRTLGTSIAAAATGVALVIPALADGPNRAGERYTSVDWALDGERQPESRTVRLRWRADGFACQYRMHRASARETPSTVTIKVLVHYREMARDEACILITAGGKTTVKLEEPLGNRKLRHAPTNDPADRTP